MSFDVLALAVTFLVGQIFPLFEVVINDLLLFGLDHEPHAYLPLLVASPAGDSRLGEVHDIEGIVDALLATFGFKVEPLLVASGIGVYLHVEVVGIL